MEEGDLWVDFCRVFDIPPLTSTGPATLDADAACLNCMPAPMPATRDVLIEVEADLVLLALVGGLFGASALAGRVRALSS